MSTIKNLSENTIECTFYNFKCMKENHSLVFSVETDCFWIGVDLISNVRYYTNEEDCWIFLLFTSFNPLNHSLYSYYILNILGRENKDYVNKKGRIRRGFNSSTKVKLLILDKEYLHQNEEFILPGGTLTLRLSLFHADEWSEDQPMYLSPTVNLPPKLNEAARLPSVRDISTNTETEENHYKQRKDITLLENLSEDLGSFYDNTTIADCVLKARKLQFPVHRAVLSARSAVFAAMFNHETKESLNGEIVIPDVDPVVLGDVLYYIYSGKIRGLTPDTAVSIYTVADKYALCKLREVCLDFLLNSLTTENICDAAVLAHMHGEIKLEEKIICFIAERVEEFMESDKWRQFAQDKSLLANKLLCSALIIGKKKTVS